MAYPIMEPPHPAATYHKGHAVGWFRWRCWVLLRRVTLKLRLRQADLLDYALEAPAGPMYPIVPPFVNKLKRKAIS